MSWKTEYEEREVTEVKKVKTSEVCFCDGCKKKLYEKIFDQHEKPLSSTWYVEMYFSVCTMNNDYGNDSIDTIKTYSLCKECLASGKIVKDYLEHIDEDDVHTQKLEIEEICKK